MERIESTVVAAHPINALLTFYQIYSLCKDYWSRRAYQKEIEIQFLIDRQIIFDNNCCDELIIDAPIDQFIDQSVQSAQSSLLFVHQFEWR